MSISLELYGVGFGLIVVGIILLVAAAVLASLHDGKRKAKAAGVIVIGPVPIIFGPDKKSTKTLLALSVTLTVCIIVAMLVYYFLFGMR